jgi:hypothetical protein
VWSVPGALSVKGMGREWTIIANTARIDLPATVVDEDEASLNDIFVAHAGTES